MAQLEDLTLHPANTGPVIERLRDLVRNLNDRLRLIRGAHNANEGAGIRWTEATLPTASATYAGRTLYHDRGQGGTADKFYVCLWTGASWQWILLA